MILKKGNLKASVVNDVQVAAYLSAGWTKEEVRAKEPETEGKKKGKDGK